MGDDLLRLGRVLRARLDEDLARLVDVGQRAMGLQVEVLLSGELECAGEHVAGGAQPLIHITALNGGLCTLELSGLDGFLDVDQGRLGLQLDHTAAAPSRAASSVSPST